LITKETNGKPRKKSNPQPACNTGGLVYECRHGGTKIPAQIHRLNAWWKSATGWRISWVETDKRYRDEHHNGNKHDSEKLPQFANADTMWDIRVDYVVTARKTLGDPTCNLLVGTSHSYNSCVLKELLPSTLPAG
jgi:hypothetical protein